MSSSGRLPSRSLDYAERTTNDSAITATAYADISGLGPITFVAPQQPIELTFYSPQVLNGTATASTFVQIVSNDGATIYCEGLFTSGVALAASPLRVSRVVVPAAGIFVPGTTYQIKAQRKVSAGSATIKGLAPNGPMYLQAVAL